MLPCQNEQIREEALQRRATGMLAPTQRLPIIVEQSICEVIIQEVELTRQLDDIRRALYFKYDYSNKAAFDTVDREGEGFIDIPILAAFFRRHDMPMSEADLFIIMRRIDVIGNAKINFEEFSEFMMPSIDDFLTKSGKGIG